MARPLTGGITATAGVGVLVVGLAAFDSRVRDHVAGFVSGVSSGGASREVTAAGVHVGDFFALIAQAVRDQSMEHALLVTFGVGALILVLFMLRT